MSAVGAAGPDRRQLAGWLRSDHPPEPRDRRSSVRGSTPRRTTPPPRAGQVRCIHRRHATANRTGTAPASGRLRATWPPMTSSGSSCGHHRRSTSDIAIGAPPPLRSDDDLRSGASGGMRSPGGRARPGAPTSHPVTVLRWAAGRRCARGCLAARTAPPLRHGPLVSAEPLRRPRDGRVTSLRSSERAQVAMPSPASRVGGHGRLARRHLYGSATTGADLPPPRSSWAPPR